MECWIYCLIIFILDLGLIFELSLGISKFNEFWLKLIAGGWQVVDYNENKYQWKTKNLRYNLKYSIYHANL